MKNYKYWTVFILLLISLVSPITFATSTTRDQTESRTEAKLKYLKCVMQEMEKQHTDSVLGIVIKYCKIRHPNAR
jgi:hypothetical protein